MTTFWEPNHLPGSMKMIVMSGAVFRFLEANCFNILRKVQNVHYMKIKPHTKCSQNHREGDRNRDWLIIKRLKIHDISKNVPVPVVQSKAHVENIECFTTVYNIAFVNSER